MRKQRQLMALVVSAVACAGYWALSPATPIDSKPHSSGIDPFGACTQATLDRTSGKTQLGFCPAQGTVTLTAGLR
jgi:hypothetical protein